jgi:anti-sigma-K factor RskA
MSPHEEFDGNLRSGLIEEYILGLCTEEERRLVEQKAASDPNFAAWLKESQSSMKSFCRKSKQKRHLRKRILKAEKGQPVETENRNVAPNIARLKQQRLWLLVASVSLLIALGLTANRKQHITYKLARLDQEYDKAITDRQLLTAEIDMLRAKFDLMQDRESELIALQADPSTTTCAAIVIWNARKQEGAIKWAKMPSNTDHHYVIWVDVKGRMVRLGSLDPTGLAWQSLSFVDQAEAFAVSQELDANPAEPDLDRIILHSKRL